jgi:hypothetical protein
MSISPKEKDLLELLMKEEALSQLPSRGFRKRFLRELQKEQSSSHSMLWTYSLAFSFILVISGSAAFYVYSSPGVTPDNSLYAVKRTAEPIELSMATTPVKKTETPIKLPDHKLQEEAVVAEDPKEISIEAINQQVVIEEVLDSQQHVFTKEVTAFQDSLNPVNTIVEAMDIILTMDSKTEFFEGVPGTIKIQIHNNFTQNSPELDLEIRFGDLRLIQKIKTLKPQEKKKITLQHTFDAAGTYPITIILDPKKKLTEKKRTNNRIYTEIKVSKKL